MDFNPPPWPKAIWVWVGCCQNYLKLIVGLGHLKTIETLEGFKIETNESI